MQKKLCQTSYFAIQGSDKTIETLRTWKGCNATSLFNKCRLASITVFEETLHNPLLFDIQCFFNTAGLTPLRPMHKQALTSQNPESKEFCV